MQAFSHNKFAIANLFLQYCGCHSPNCICCNYTHTSTMRQARKRFRSLRSLIFAEKFCSERLYDFVELFCKKPDKIGKTIFFSTFCDRKRANPNARDTKKGRKMRPYLCKPNRAEGLQVAFFRVRGRRAHTLTYVTEPETRRKGARCALILGLAERVGFAPLAQQQHYLAQPRLGIFVPSKSISETCETVKCRSEVFCAREREILSEFRG